MQVETKSPTKPQTETEKLFALDRPSLENLSYALRHPEAWPKSFVWDFNNCNKCAMGLAHHLWQSSIPSVDRNSGASVMARVFAMPYATARRIFVSRKGKSRRLWVFPATPPFGSVTPEMVADQIDKYLAEDRANASR